MSMNRKIIAAAFAVSLILSGCGILDEAAEMISEKNSTEEESSFSEVQPTPIEENDETSKEISEEYSREEEEVSEDSDIDYLSEPDEDEMMEIDMKRHTMKEDEEGFVIKNGILYDYRGVRSEVHIPEGVKRIESGAFWSIDYIKAVYIPSSVEAIGDNAFWSCSGLEYVELGDGLKKIGSGAFWSCSGLEHITIPENVDDISIDVLWAIDDITVHGKKGTYAEEFADSRGFTFTEEPYVYSAESKGKVISAGMYRYKDFEEFEIPDDITGIDAEAFQYCENLKYINIPSNVDYIGSNAFEYCDELEKADISCREIKAEAFEYCRKISEVIIHDGCEKIGSEAFSYCDCLSSVYIPASVQSIDKRAFEYTSEYLVLHVESGSYAEDFAKAMKIPYDYNTMN